MTAAPYGRHTLLIFALVSGLSMSGAGLAAAVAPPAGGTSSSIALLIDTSPELLQAATTDPQGTPGPGTHYADSRVQDLHTEVELRVLDREGRAARSTDDTHQ
ncbi:hypothetical protein IWX75_003382 [Arthrobacter sp. CAN_A6]|uniref:hypothetical protein n=1 Tax=Arthrobacter sp. CAN_A6 TaxID=2787721 RepID=UPI0018CB4963